MVAGNGQHAQTRRHRIGQKRVKYGNSLGARRCLIVHITGNQKHADLVLLRNIQYLPQNIALIVQHRHAVNALSDMQIGNMQHLHLATPFVESRITGPAPRTAQTMYHRPTRISNSCTMHGTATAFSWSRQQLIAHSGYRIAINLAMRASANISSPGIQRHCLPGAIAASTRRKQRPREQDQPSKSLRTR